MLIERIIRRYAAKIVLLRAWRSGISVGSGLVVDRAPFLLRCDGSRLCIGENVTIISRPETNPTGMSHRAMLSTIRPGAFLSIGNYVGISGASICCSIMIEIGDHVNIGSNCLIVDSDMHPIDPVSRLARDGSKTKQKRVSIGKNVWLGASCIILKGVEIGENSIIGAGSVVSRSIPANSIACGNPALVVTKIA